MFDNYYECTVCIYETNSPKHADKHEDNTGHAVNLVLDSIDPVE